MNRSDEVIALINSNPGPAYRLTDRTMLSAFIKHELASNRWAMVIDRETGRLNGWISWYCLDLASLLMIYTHGLPECFDRDIPLSPGREVYICNAIVHHDAPRGTFRKLWNMAVRANPGANSFNAHLRNRENQPMRWFCKVVNRRRSL